MPKRKYSQIELSVEPIEFIRCDICADPVYNYRYYNCPYGVFCSEDCFEILYLQYKCPNLFHS